MFRRVYKSANDDIVPNDELLERILAEGKKPQKNHRTYYSYGSMAACLFIAIGTLAIYPSIKKDISSPKNTAQDVIVETLPPKFSDAELVSKPEEFETEETEIPTNTQEYRTSKPEKKASGKTVSKSKENTKTTDKAEKTVKQQQTKKAATSVEGLSPTSPSPTNQPAAESKVTESSDVPVAQENTPEVASVPMVAAQRSMEEPFETDSNEVLFPENEKNVSSGGGGSAKQDARMSRTMSESEAKQIANNIFAADFGQEFLNSSDILADYSGYYTITRYNESASYSVIVYDDGTTKKLY